MFGWFRFATLLNGKYEDVYVTNTQFYDAVTRDRVKRVVENIQEKPRKQLIIPKHLNDNHWTCGVVAFHQKKTFYYDSFGKPSDDDRSTFNTFVNENVCRLLNINDTFQSVNTETFDYPMQKGGNDCGMFVIRYMDYLCRGVVPQKNVFDQSNIEYFRYRTAYELLHNRLME